MKEHFLDDPAKIIVSKNDLELLIMSRFAPGVNMVTRYIEGNENSFLLPENMPLEKWHQGRLWACCWDNNAPFITGIHDIIGGNHGSPFAFRVKMLRHWLFNKNIGSVWTDDAGKKFVLTRVVSSGEIVLHSDIPPAGEKFTDTITGALHGEQGSLVPETVKRCMIDPPPGEQLSPHYRYNMISFYADGEKVADGETVCCRRAELRCEAELILVDDWLAALKSAPGRYISQIAPELPGAVKCSFTTVFRPKCSRTVDCEVEFLRDFPESIRFGVLQFYTEAKFGFQERLMPGVKKITDCGMEMDFSAGFRFPENFRWLKFFTKADCIDPHRLLDRSIDFFGGEQREIGVALGYSLTRGITARGNEALRSENLLQLRETRKNYPYALELNRAAQGEKFLICSYMHYFAPDSSGVSCYHLEQADGYFVYADFPGACENFPVLLPPETAGKSFTVLEHDADVALKDVSGTVPADGRIVFCASGCGGIVVKIAH